MREWTMFFLLAVIVLPAAWIDFRHRRIPNELCLAGIDGFQVEPPQSNILFVDITGAAKARSAGLIDHLAAHGVLATGLYRLRFVTHLDVDAEGVDCAAGLVRDYFKH